jgi:hypothetical protein
MDALPDPTIVLLRRGNKRPVAEFERTVFDICRRSGHLQGRWMLPDPIGGPGAAFTRDIEMVALADLVLAFFAPYHAMEGGTGHVVEVAIDRNVPVYSYTLDDTLTRVGDHDPEAIWQPLIKEYFDQPSADQ